MGTILPGPRVMPGTTLAGLPQSGQPLWGRRNANPLVGPSAMVRIGQIRSLGVLTIAKGATDSNRWKECVVVADGVRGIVRLEHGELHCLDGLEKYGETRA